MRNGCIKDKLTLVDIQEIVRRGAKVIRIHAGVIHRERFEISHFRKFFEIFFT